MRLAILLTAITCVSGCAVCAQADPIVYDAADNFLTGNNPNDVWTYGYYDTSIGLYADTITAFEYKTDWSYRDGAASDLISWQRSYDLTDPSFVVNQSASVVDVFAYLWQPGKLAVDSWSLAPYVVPVLRWQAPQAGTVDISTVFTDMGASHTTGNVLDNNYMTLFSASTATTGSVSYSTPSSLYVNAGDSIYFRALEGSVTQLDAIVTLTPGDPIPPLPAEVIDFSTDPNLSTDWATVNYFDPQNDGCPNSTAAWNAGDQNLDLVSNNEEGLKLLLKKGAARSATDTVTMQVSDYVSNDPAEVSNWTACGLVLSAIQTPGIFSGVPQYELSIERDFNNGIHCAFSRGSEIKLFKRSYDTMPSNVKLDIVYDSDTSEFVFLVDDVELCRDSTYTAEQLPYYSMYWGGGATDTLSVSVDNFGTGSVTSLPGDANRDGVVNADDASILASHWQMQSGAVWADGDFNGDNMVNDIDATILATNWQTSASNAVPEPSAIISAIVGLICLLASGYRRSK